jgi:hypothetical protein
VGFEPGATDMDFSQNSLLLVMTFATTNYMVLSNFCHAARHLVRSKAYAMTPSFISDQHIPKLCRVRSCTVGIEHEALIY